MAGLDAALFQGIPGSNMNSEIPMSFAFRKKESVHKGICRLVCKRIERALECLDAKDKPGAVHGVRKEIKKLRSILRLVRSELGTRNYRRETAALREMAGHLAGARDAYVKLQAFEHLIEHFHGQLAKQPFIETRKALQENCRGEIKQFLEAGSAKVVRGLLQKMARRSEDFKIKSDGWTAIAPGVKWSYGCGRQSYQEVLSDPNPETFHEWRKRVKDLWYHLRLLSPIWPEQMSAAAQTLGQLSDYLGDDHDLVLLEQQVKKKDHIPPEELETLNGLVELRHKELRGAALAIGARYYAEKPAVFCKRLGQYWKTWAEEPELQKAVL